MTSIVIPLSNNNSGTYKFITRGDGSLVCSMELKISDFIPEQNNVWATVNGTTDNNNTNVYIDPENSSMIVIPCRINMNVNSQTIFLHLGNVNRLIVHLR